MSLFRRTRSNDPCPCGSARKYKTCCRGKIDWDSIFRNNRDPVPYLSVRGRNIKFINEFTNILNLGSDEIFDLEKYKSQFSASAVRDIHEATLKYWPTDSDIVDILERTSTDVSGLYIGDYDLEYLTRGIVRHSIYANKILIVDPFIYPRSVRDEFNPINNPQKFRTQTLRNINFWISMIPWIDEGLIEIIRTPVDFDHRLNWESMKRQQKKFETIPALKEALEISSEEMMKRHMKNMSRQHLLLGAPDSYLRRIMKETNAETDKVTADDVPGYIAKLRSSDPNFLEPMGVGEKSAEFHVKSTGASYDVALMVARITNSYLVTDLYSKWKEIELDGDARNAENQIWSPFAKALQQSPLRFLNKIDLPHALALRKEGRLGSLRGFLFKVWKSARTDAPFDETNARYLAEELVDEISKAEVEWKKINEDLLKQISQEAGAALLAAGPLIALGHGAFLAGAAALKGGHTFLDTYLKRKRFPDRFPAAFFMNIKDGES